LVRGQKLRPLEIGLIAAVRTNRVAVGASLRKLEGCPALNMWLSESACTTEPYDRIGDEITLDEVERITI
jgi:hypothetical protein